LAALPLAEIPPRRKRGSGRNGLLLLDKIAAGDVLRRYGRRINVRSRAST
jgi:hypothetical protein